MKKIIAVSLTLVMLVLCGCGASTSNLEHSNSHDTPENGQTSSATEATLPPIDSYSDKTGLVIDVAMGAEFTLELSLFHTILSVTPQNEDAETLFSGLEMEGIHYHFAMPMILDAAKAQGFLNSGTAVTLTASEHGQDAWNVASHNILTKSIKDYQKDQFADFTWELVPAGLAWDVDSYTDTHTNHYDDHTETICYGYGMHEMTYYIYKDGTYREIYHLSLEEKIRCTYYPDDSFEYSLGLANYLFHYRIYSDGTLQSGSMLYDENHNPIKTSDIYADGSKYEATYENGIMATSKSESPSGDIDESTYFPNGSIATCKLTRANGEIIEWAYYESGIQASYSETYPNGDYTSTTYTEQGVTISNISQIDGNHTEITYYENGMVKSVISQFADGTTNEEYFDSNGNQISAPTE